MRAATSARGTRGRDGARERRGCRALRPAACRPRRSTTAARAREPVRNVAAEDAFERAHLFVVERSRENVRRAARLRLGAVARAARRGFDCGAVRLGFRLRRARTRVRARRVRRPAIPVTSGFGRSALHDDDSGRVRPRDAVRGSTMTFRFDDGSGRRRVPAHDFRFRRRRAAGATTTGAAGSSIDGVDGARRFGLRDRGAAARSARRPARRFRARRTGAARRTRRGRRGARGAARAPRSRARPARSRAR